MAGLKWHDFLIMALCVLVLVASTVFMVMNYSSLPEEVPTNFDFQGNVTGTGGRGSVIALIVMNWVLAVPMLVSLFFPGVWNLPSVKPQNAARAMAIGRKMIELLTLAMVVFMTYMFLVLAQMLPMQNIALTAFVAVIVLLTAIPLVLIFRLK